MAFKPLIRVELAELAGRRGDREARERELHAAHRLFATFGPNANAERLAGELELLQS